jgi:hypothetical protein
VTTERLALESGLLVVCELPPQRPRAEKQSRFASVMGDAQSSSRVCPAKAREEFTAHG